VKKIVDAATPRIYRKALAARLFENYSSLPDYLLNAARLIFKAVTVQAGPALSGWRLLGDAACVIVAFSPVVFTAAGLTPVLAILAVAIPTLIWRDAHIEPPERTADEAAIDGIWLAAAAAFSQPILFLISDSLTIPWPWHLYTLPAGAMLLAIWRFYFRQAKAGAVLRAYQKAEWMTQLWMCDCVVLCLSNTQIVPSFSELQKFLFTALPLPIYVIALRRKSNAIGGMSSEPLTELRIDLEEIENQARTNSVAGSSGQQSSGLDGNWWLKALFFALLAYPIGSALLDWLLADAAAEKIDWLQFGVSAGTFLTLSVAWWELEKINRQVTLALQEEVAAAKRKKAGTA
jgi:hypothetical protein